MYFRFIGPVGGEKVKVPEEIAGEVPKELTAEARDDYIMGIIYSDRYYKKGIPQAVAEFLRYFYMNTYTPGGYPIFDEMEVDDLTVCVVGRTKENKANTTMFAYRKEQKSDFS